jgi:hypothetical protein
MEKKNTQSRHHQRLAAKLKRQLKEALAESDKLKEKFEIEMNAKNEAYGFILSNGMLMEFAEYHRATANIDPMLICRVALEAMTTTPKNEG